MLEKRLSKIQDKTGATDMYVDGGYFKQLVRFFSGDIRKKAEKITNNSRQGVIAPIC